MYNRWNVASHEHENKESKVFGAQINTPLCFVKRMREAYTICSAQSDKLRKPSFNIGTSASSEHYFRNQRGGSGLVAHSSSC